MIVFETNEVTFHRFKLILVCFKINLLLFSNLFTELNLSEGVLKLHREATILFFLLLDSGCAFLVLLIVHQVNVSF